MATSAARTAPEARLVAALVAVRRSAGSLHVHGHDEPRVVVEAHRARQHQDDDQRPERGVRPGRHHVELADEAGREWHAREREERHREGRGQRRAARGQSAVVLDPVRVALGRRKRRDDAEGDEGGGEVGDEVEGHRHGGPLTRGKEGHQHVAEVGDRGVGQDALHVVLAQRQKVPDDHRGDGDDGERDEQRRLRGEAERAEEAQQQRDHRALRHRRHVGRHGRRGALVDVRRPHVEGHDGELEADADEDQHHADGHDQAAAREGVLEDAARDRPTT